ncbi:unnamed protein product, partial [Ostreobium quekettii]
GTSLRNGGHLLADPHIYSKNSYRFGPCDKGAEGMAAFLQTHVCNHLCERLIGAGNERKRSLSRASKTASVNGRRSFQGGALGMPKAPKLWTVQPVCSVQSMQSLQDVETISQQEWLTPRSGKPVKHEWSPMWRALKKKGKV